MQSWHVFSVKTLLKKNVEGGNPAWSSYFGLWLCLKISNDLLKGNLSYWDIERKPDEGCMDMGKT